MLACTSLAGDVKTLRALFSSGPEAPLQAATVLRDREPCMPRSGLERTSNGGLVLRDHHTLGLCDRTEIDIGIGISRGTLDSLLLLGSVALGYLPGWRCQAGGLGLNENILGVRGSGSHTFIKMLAEVPPRHISEARIVSHDPVLWIPVPQLDIAISSRVLSQYISKTAMAWSPFP